MIHTLNALAEPNRLRIVTLLRQRPHAVGELARQLKLRQPQTSKHLHILGDAGLVIARSEAQRRIYSLRPEPLHELDLWLQQYRTLWEGNFQRLDTLLEELKESPAKLKSEK